MLISKIKTKEEAQDIFNDQIKFAKFVEKNKRFLTSIIGKVRNVANYDMDDLYQEAQIALYNALREYDPEKRIAIGKKSASFSTYSYWLIRNEIYHTVYEQNKRTSIEKSIELFKREQPNNEGTTTAGGNGGDSYTEEKFINRKEYTFENDVIQKIDDDRLIEKLGPTEKIIFEKKIIEERTHDEVAKELGLPAATYMTIFYKSFIPKLQSMGYKVTNTHITKRKNETVKSNSKTTTGKIFKGKNRKRVDKIV